MAETLTDNYAELADLKDHLGITGSARDDLLIRAINAASRRVDRHTGRVFTTETSATARVYAPRQYRCAVVHDFHTTTGLEIATDETGDGTYETTWSAGTDYQLEPLNGVVDGRTGFPYNRVRAIGTKRFPIDYYGQTRLQVTARWGWSAVPDDVEEATILLAAQMYRLKDAPLGVAGGNEFGAVRVRDVPHVRDLLRDVRRRRGFA